ncbi:MAG: alpha/beta hydrolase fold domain-containing protein [Anaerolineaceae bacterium]|nr:alpha/beta hydrolase fold domain-containing protein [Anaerolineaceae bacterium]
MTTAYVNSALENKIRVGLRVTRLFVAYAPFNLVRRLQKLALYHVKLAADIQASLTDKPVGEWFVSKDADEHSPVIMYVHGGGFVLPQTHFHRMMLAQLTREVKGRTFAVDYRLAPEYPFPAGLDDCLEAYQYLLDEGIAPERITVMGDSAGGNLVLSMLITLRDRNLPLPKLGICISAPTDFTDENPAHDVIDDLLHPRAISRFSLSYVVNQDVRNPLISPLFADLHGLPPLILYAGAKEALSSDSVRFAEAAQGAGVDVTLHVYPGMWHVWQLQSELPQAQQSLAEIADAVRSACGARDTVRV